MQITELFRVCWKGKSKTGRDLCNSAVFLTSLYCFAGIEMQKRGESGRGEGSSGALAYLIQSCTLLLSLNEKYTFYFRF
jgi:hypothetical protein